MPFMILPLLTTSTRTFYFGWLHYHMCYHHLVLAYYRILSILLMFWTGEYRSMILELYCCFSLLPIAKKRDSLWIMFFEQRHFELLKCAI
jgi:hypothetical protein